MTRIVVDTKELQALAALCRNASYDAAGVASEARQRTESLRQALTRADRAGEAEALAAEVDAAAATLLQTAALLDHDALLLAQMGEAAGTTPVPPEAIAGAFGGGEHALLSQLREERP